jgi:hypothetical protein
MTELVILAISSTFIIIIIPSLGIANQPKNENMFFPQIWLILLWQDPTHRL